MGALVLQKWVPYKILGLFSFVSTILWTNPIISEWMRGRYFHKKRLYLRDNGIKTLEEAKLSYLCSCGSSIRVPHPLADLRLLNICLWAVQYFSLFCFLLTNQSLSKSAFFIRKIESVTFVWCLKILQMEFIPTRPFTDCIYLVFDIGEIF